MPGTHPMQGCGGLRTTRANSRALLAVLRFWPCANFQIAVTYANSLDTRQGTLFIAFVPCKTASFLTPGLLLSLCPLGMPTCSNTRSYVQNCPQHPVDYAPHGIVPAPTRVSPTAYTHTCIDCMEVPASVAPLAALPTCLPACYHHRVSPPRPPTLSPVFGYDSPTTRTLARAPYYWSAHTLGPLLTVPRSHPSPVSSPTCPTASQVTSPRAAFGSQPIYSLPPPPGELLLGTGPPAGYPTQHSNTQTPVP